jgi:protoporphyrinogen oxidase
MQVDIVIAGGGITGLGVARELRIEGCLFEKETRLGGCLRSDFAQGYTVDRTGHVLHVSDPYARRLLFQELPIEMLRFRRSAEIHILKRRVPFPIQYNLKALPDETRRSCLASYLEASGQQPSLQDSFERWSRLSYGDRLHELFFAPYNRKLWQADLETMNAEWTERFVPMPDRDLVVRGAQDGHNGRAFGYNAAFSYPRRGGSQAIIDALSADTTFPIRTGAELMAVDLHARICEFSDGSRIRYRELVSTLPLPRLLRLLHPPEEGIRAMGERLRHNSIFYFAFGYRLNGAPPPAQHWIYLPETHFLPYRVGVLSNYSPELAPPGSVLLCVEIGFPADEAARVDPSALRSRVLDDLDAIGLANPAWTLEFEHHGSIDCAYVIFDQARRDALPEILGYLRSFGVHSIGRYGAWGYGSVQDALIEGRDCAERLNEEFGQARQESDRLPADATL